MSDISNAIESLDAASVRRWAEGYTDPELSEQLTRLSTLERAVAFRFLDKERALRVFELLDPAYQVDLLDDLKDTEVLSLVEELDPDDRATLLDEMPAKVAKRLLDRVSPAERARTSLMLGYPAESAGRIMTPEYVSVRANQTVAQALDRIRNKAVDAETVYVVYAMDGARHLRGVISLKDLVLADPQALVADVMTTEAITASVDEDQETVSRRLQDHDLIAVPVLDREERMVGIVTVDDAMDVLRDENTEDVTLIGGSRPLDRPYAAAGVLSLFRARVPWLLVLFVAESFTGEVLRNFEHQLETVVALAFFIPLLIDTGGNAGSQTATTVIRAMAIGELRFTDLGRVVSKEVRVGLLLGGAMAAVGAVRAALWGTGSGLILTVGLSLIAMVVLATLVGSVLPVVIQRLRRDPAVVSAPFITTFVDATGLFIYFSIARAVMGI